MADLPKRQGVPLSRRPVTISLSVVLGLIYLLQAAAGHSFMQFPPALLARLGGNEPSLTRGGHEYWRLLTSLYLHGGLMHVAFNVYALVIIGTAVEVTIGGGWVMVAFVASGITGSIVSAVGHHPGVVAIGASSGIFGLIAMAAAITFLAPNETGLQRRALVQWIVYGLVLGLMPGLDNWGHLGGVLGGVLVAFLVAHLRHDIPSYVRWSHALAAGAIALSAVCIGFAARSYHQPSLAADDKYDNNIDALVSAINDGDVARAAAAASVALKGHPDDSQTQFFVGRADELRGDCESAIVRMKKALRPPGPGAAPVSDAFVQHKRAIVHLSIAHCLDKLGKAEEARGQVAQFCQAKSSIPIEERPNWKATIEQLCPVQ